MSARHRPIGAVAVSLLVAGCGGAAIDPVAYYQALADAGAVHADAGAAAERGLSATPDRLTNAKQVFPEFVDDLRGFVRTLEGLTAPDEAAAAHETAERRGEAAVAAFQAVADEVSAIDDPATLAAFFQSPTWRRAEQAGANLYASCIELQSIADDTGIAIDLHCS